MVNKKQLNIIILIAVLIFLILTLVIFKKEDNVRFDCNDKQECAVVAVPKDGQSIEVFKGYALSPSLVWHSKELAEFKFSCGSPCNSSIFIKFPKPDISAIFQDVVAVDHSRNFVVTASFPEVSVKSLFDGKKIINIKRDYAPAATLVSDIVSAEFSSNGDLKMKYLKGINFEEVTETINIK